MDISIKPTALKGEVTVPASKTYAHRMLIAAALADKPTKIMGKFSAKDIVVTIEAIKAIGARVEECDGGIIVSPIEKVVKGRAIIDACESGSTLRFMLPVVASIGARTTFFGQGRLGSRPLLDIITTLKQGGISCSGDRLPLTISGKLEGNVHRIDGSLSSQYITGLMLAEGAKDSGGKIIVEGKKVSAAYINNTIEVLKMFGVDTQTEEYGYNLSGNGYKSPSICKVPSDWSSAAFFAVAGAINGDIKLEGLSYPSSQADSAIIGFLRDMGAHITICDNSVTVKKSDLRGLECSITDCPDLAPVLAVAMACASGNSVIRDVKRLRIKESDRLQAIINMLANLGIASKTDGDNLYITGGRLIGGNVDGCNDHRMVMAGVVAGSVAGGTTVVCDSEACAKSYADFVEDFMAIGGAIC
ncbi:MAG: 3-phosphoshikimate 1-carboxyvinyltransferase [Bacillota bacterium]